MSDRLQEIRARLSAATATGWWDTSGVEAVTPWRGGVASLVANAPADIAWLLAGYALAVDTIWAGCEAMRGRRMPPAERTEMLAAWGVTEDDIAWAKEQEGTHA